MKYTKIVEFYEKIEQTTKRLEMTDYLVGLFKETPKEIIDKVVYLTQGKIYPDFVELELGVAEKMAMRAIANATGATIKDIEEDFKKTGDLGLTTENFIKRKRQLTLFAKPLTVDHVYNIFDKIAKATGEGSQDLKIRLLSGLLTNAQPNEGKYIIRTVTGRLRLGIADMTILDALAIAFTGSKENRPLLERAYNLCSDLGEVAKTVAEKGVEGVKQFKIRVGRPIRPMLAQRLSTPEEILEKLGGKAACEWKFDGERVQIHKDGSNVQLFSRRLENITEQYPDVQDYVRKHIKANEVIVEGEIVAIDPETEEMLPFQELMHRRRKYEIEKAIEMYPVNVYLFDILYVDGEDFTIKPYTERRSRLKEIIDENHIKIAPAIITNDIKEIEKFFEEAIESGCEGLLLKSVKPDSIYQAGARGWLWIKLKRSYQSKMIEPIDVVIVGAFAGKGKRAGTYGALLVAAYNKEKDVFETICKVGSGFTDEDLENLPKILEEYKIEHPHPRVVTKMEPDYWFVPAKVIEIIGDELTLSPVHTCAWGVIKEEAGVAVRFPRFTGRWRDDKAPEDATTTQEIIQMYKAQLKTIS